MVGDEREAVASASEEALLLREMCHRTATEVAAASAAIALVGAVVPKAVRVRQVDHALSRLHGFGELNRLLSRPLPARVELAIEFASLCKAIVHGRTGVGASRMDLDLSEAWATGAVARRLLVAGAALVAESVALALRDRAGRLRVVLRREDVDVALTVEDDGPGPRLFAGGSEAGRGRTLLAELVGRGDGTMTMVTGRRGTRVSVVMPAGLEADDDDFAF